MDVEWFYCHDCGYENYNIYVKYSHAVANGDVYICPLCGEESMSVEVGECE